MVKAFNCDADLSYLERLIAYCGFSPDYPIFLAREKFQPLPKILDLTFRTIQLQSNESFALECGDHDERLHMVPEGVRIIGSGAATAVRGGTWHELDHNLLFMGWGYYSYPEDGQWVDVVGECLVLSPACHPDHDPKGPREDYYCQLRPEGLDPKSERAEWYRASFGRDLCDHD